MIAVVEFALAIGMISVGVNMIYFGYRFFTYKRGEQSDALDYWPLYPIACLALLVGGASLFMVAVIGIFF